MGILPYRIIVLLSETHEHILSIQLMLDIVFISDGQRSQRSLEYSVIDAMTGKASDTLPDPVFRKLSVGGDIPVST